MAQTAAMKARTEAARPQPGNPPARRKFFLHPSGTLFERFSYRGRVHPGRFLEHLRRAIPSGPQPGV